LAHKEKLDLLDLKARQAKLDLLGLRVSKVFKA
jgi:hypothetical protein